VTDLRPARVGDVDQIARLEAEVFDENAWSGDAVAVELADAGDRQAWVSTDGETVVGYAVLRHAGEVADVLRLAVSPSHRRRARATALLSELTDYARNVGCLRMLLEVAADNSAALRLYTAHGFVEIERRRRYYRGDVDAVVLQRRL
jgi:ribosomal-protein-alanine N-acetyltransferase